ncbi:hypothetical protein DFH07DRAFT_939154 [Mycena maculata]|uniref:Amidohydrolase 3 domain-containing protein n=1 Tax=Mycena maculata TaxID=230809 RepID=A0AAD7JJJ6_9AGAR|nr:hypothetical protein DFH07DRAFT_939154 [Mycena maculata]
MVHENIPVYFGMRLMAVIGATQDFKLVAQDNCLSRVCLRQSACTERCRSRRVTSLKIFADDALRTGGSALYEPYTDNPGTNGFMRLPSEVLFELIPRFLRAGWQVNAHAIGDRGKRNRSRCVRGFPGGFPLIASVQPMHAISDMWYAQDRLGPERIMGLYAFRSLLDSGARITLGSDFPVETVNQALRGIFLTISLSATAGMTIDPAYASFTEPELGSLEAGKLADFVVLSRDIMKIPAKEILQTRVLATVIDGNIAYGSL